jgi:hypothetical protein
VRLDRRKLAQPFGQADLRFVVEVGPGHMQKTARLRFDRRDHHRV